MKKLLLTFLAFTAGFLPLAAQDWAPFKLGRTPYFQAGDSIYSLRITNMYVQGSDSVFEFNPRVVPFTSIQIVTGCSGAVQAGAGKTLNNLFGNRMIKTASADYKFIFAGGDTFLLKPASTFGTSWNFNSSLSATVLSRDLEPVLGASDSVTTIILADGEQIKISKKYGLLNARSFYSYVNSTSNQALLSLIRIAEPGSGDQLSHAFSIYDYQPGDKFLHHGKKWDGFTYCYEYWTTTEVLSRNQNPDSVWYSLRKQKLTIAGASPASYCFVNPGTTLSDFDTVEFVVSTTRFPHLQALSREYKIQPSPWSIFINSGMFVCNLNSRLATAFSILYPDTCSFTFNSVPDALGNYHYAEGLGLIKYNGDASYENLIAYIKGTETYGNWQPLVLSAEDEVAANPVQVYPNPFTNELSITLPQNQPAEIVIYNLQGQKIQALQTNGNAILQLPELPTGLYLLHVLQGEQKYKVKIQKQ